jgi:hypothetical protein
MAALMIIAARMVDRFIRSNEREIAQLPLAGKRAYTAMEGLKSRRSVAGENAATGFVIRRLIIAN